MLYCRERERHTWEQCCDDMDHSQLEIRSELSSVFPPHHDDYPLLSLGVGHSLVSSVIVVYLVYTPCLVYVHIY